jgi:hypothetical protein
MCLAPGSWYSLVGGLAPVSWFIPTGMARTTCLVRSAMVARSVHLVQPIPHDSHNLFGSVRATGSLKQIDAAAAYGSRCRFDSVLEPGSLPGLGSVNPLGSLLGFGSNGEMGSHS